MNLVWKLDPEALTNMQRFVLLALADSANDDGVCWPSIEAIGLKVGLKERGTQKHLDALEEAGWFVRRRRVFGRKISTYRYDIVVQMLEANQHKRTGTTGTNVPVDNQHECAGTNQHKRAGHKNHQVEPSGRNHQRPRSPGVGGKKNQFAGKCALCGCVVEAGEGRLIGKEAAHRLGECAAPKKILGPGTRSLTKEDWTTL